MREAYTRARRLLAVSQTLTSCDIAIMGLGAARADLSRTGTLQRHPGRKGLLSDLFLAVLILANKTKRMNCVCLSH